MTGSCKSFQPYRDCVIKVKVWLLLHSSCTEQGYTYTSLPGVFTLHVWAGYLMSKLPPLCNAGSRSPQCGRCQPEAWFSLLNPPPRCIFTPQLILDAPPDELCGAMPYAWCKERVLIHSNGFFVSSSPWLSLWRVALAVRAEAAELLQVVLIAGLQHKAAQDCSTWFCSLPSQN